MARVIFHEHPRQGGACLSGAFAAYVKRIPLDAFRSLDAVWRAIRELPFEADLGPTWGRCLTSPCPLPRKPNLGGDTRCSPVQRSRVWPDRVNCWEATAHFTAAAIRFLGDDWAVHVWDRDLPNGARHLWPSLISPRGDHLLVDLKSTASSYPKQGFSASYRPGIRNRTKTTAQKGYGRLEDT